MRFLSLVNTALLTLACSSSSTGKPAGSGGSSAAGSAGSTGVAGAAGTGTAGNGAAGTGTAGMAGSAGTAGTAGATGTAGMTGAAGTMAAAGMTGAAGMAGSTGAAGMAVDASQSVLTRNKHETRDGFFVQPTLTKAMAAKMAPDAAFLAKFSGSMWASPLYAENGPGGKGAFFAAATNNNVYALDETTGAILWMHSIGAAPQQSGAGCGTIHPIGIISTPVIDVAARTIYIAGGIGPGDIQRHEIHALDLDNNGVEKAGWPINVSAMKDPGGLAFPTKAQNQRSALSLVNGILYVAYGGHNNDCGNYHGWVIAVDTKDPTKKAAWASAGTGEAIWASGGMASDGTSIFAITGNRLGDSSTHQDSEEVVRLTGMAQLDRTTGIFYPNQWRSMDSADADFGSSSPVVFQVPGSTPSTLVGAAANIFGLDARGVLHLERPEHPVQHMATHVADGTIAEIIPAVPFVRVQVGMVIPIRRRANPRIPMQPLRHGQNRRTRPHAAIGAIRPTVRLRHVPNELRGVNQHSTVNKGHLSRMGTTDTYRARSRHRLFGRDVPKGGTIPPRKPPTTSEQSENHLKSLGLA